MKSCPLKAHRPHHTYAPVALDWRLNLSKI